MISWILTSIRKEWKSLMKIEEVEASVAIPAPMPENPTSIQQSKPDQSNQQGTEENAEPRHVKKRKKSARNGEKTGSISGKKTTANSSRNRQKDDDRSSVEDEGEDKREDETKAPSPPLKKQKQHPPNKNVMTGGPKSTETNSARMPTQGRPDSDSYRPCYRNTSHSFRGHSPDLVIQPKSKNDVPTKPNIPRGPRNDVTSRQNIPRGPKMPEVLDTRTAPPPSGARTPYSGAKTPGSFRNNHNLDTGFGGRTPGSVVERKPNQDWGARTPGYSQNSPVDDSGFTGHTPRYVEDRKPSQTQGWGSVTPRADQRRRNGHGDGGGRTPYSQRGATGGSHHHFKDEDHSFGSH